MAETGPAVRAPRRGAWDFTLMALTVALLAALGVQSFVGTLYAWWAYRAQPGWEQLGYPAFVDTMNAIAGPLVIALVVVMGLCVPKRLFRRRALVAASALMLAAGVGAGVVARSVDTGLGVYLGLAALIQVAVVALTLANAGGLTYVTEGVLAKTGSGLLHLGFVLFCLVVVSLQGSRWMLPVFWSATLLLAGGSALSFWARPRPTDPSGG